MLTQHKLHWLDWAGLGASELHGTCMATPAACMALSYSTLAAATLSSAPAIVRAALLAWACGMPSLLAVSPLSWRGGMRRAFSSATASMPASGDRAVPVHTQLSADTSAACTPGLQMQARSCSDIAATVPAAVSVLKPACIVLVQPGKHVRAKLLFCGPHLFLASFLTKRWFL